MDDFIALNDATRSDVFQTSTEGPIELITLFGCHVVRVVFVDDDHMKGGAFGEVRVLIEDDATVFDVGFERKHQA